MTTVVFEPLWPGYLNTDASNAELIKRAEEMGYKYEISTSLPASDYIKAHIGAMWLEFEKAMYPDLSNEIYKIPPDTVPDGKK